MHSAFNAVLALDARKICLLDYGPDALTEPAKILEALQQDIAAKGPSYGDGLPAGLGQNNMLFGGQDISGILQNLQRRGGSRRTMTEADINPRSKTTYPRLTALSERPSSGATYLPLALAWRDLRWNSRPPRRP